MSTKAAAKDDRATDNDVNQNTENKEVRMYVAMFLYTTCVAMYITLKSDIVFSFHGFLEDLLLKKVLRRCTN